MRTTARRLLTALALTPVLAGYFAGEVGSGAGGAPPRRPPAASPRGAARPGPVYLLRHHLLPAVLPALVRNALLRLPATVLVLASLGLGEQPPIPEWGRPLSENQPYADWPPGPSSARPPPSSFSATTWTRTRTASAA
ncbi:hypothetical protein [Streptomyces sp. NPDC101166]|uniref:hypothetical protein n=1 Tax=Streptomyces sp. NPDC101166 TaxID=3366120 RepID=UPI0038073820